MRADNRKFIFETVAQFHAGMPVPHPRIVTVSNHIGFPKGGALWPPEAFPMVQLRSGLFLLKKHDAGLVVSRKAIFFVETLARRQF